MVERVGHEGEHGPPVTGSARGRAGRRNRIAVPEHHRVDRLGKGVGAVFGHLAQAGHGAPFVGPRPNALPVSGAAMR